MNGDNAKVFLQMQGPKRNHGTTYFIVGATIVLGVTGVFFISKYFLAPRADSVADSQSESAGASDESSAGVDNGGKLYPDGAHSALPPSETDYALPAVKPPKPPPDFYSTEDFGPVAEEPKPSKPALEKAIEAPKKKIVTAPAPQERSSKPPATSAVIKGTPANFSKEVDHSKGVVLVDFWATWCGPCRQLSPFVDQMATEFKGKVKVVKVNVDEAQALSNRFKVSAIPCLLIFKDGKLVAQQVGAQSKDALKAWVGRFAN